MSCLFSERPYLFLIPVATLDSYLGLFTKLTRVYSAEKTVIRSKFKVTCKFDNFILSSSVISRLNGMPDPLKWCFSFFNLCVFCLQIWYCSVPACSSIYLEGHCCNFPKSTMKQNDTHIALVEAATKRSGGKLCGVVTHVIDHYKYTNTKHKRGTE